MLPDNAPGSDVIGAAAREALFGLIERVERLNADKDNITADTKLVYDEAKALGFDTKVLRKIVAERKRDKNDVADERALMDLYRDALRGFPEAS